MPPSSPTTEEPPPHELVARYKRPSTDEPQAVLGVQFALTYAGLVNILEHYATDHGADLTLPAKQVIAKVKVMLHAHGMAVAAAPDHRYHHLREWAARHADLVWKEPA